MTSVDEHADRIRRLVRPVLEALDPEEVALASAAARVLVADILSPVDLPLFRNSQMDGFAVRTPDVEALPVTLPVVAEIPAGSTEEVDLPRGTAARVMTGAPVPGDADLVLPVEDVETDGSPAEGGPPDRITVRRLRGLSFIRARGDDLSAGDVLVPSGTRLAARHLAALASAGVAGARVRRRPRVALLTTGTELRDPGSGDPGPGGVFDANLPALVALVEEAGAVVASARRTDDRPDAFAAALHDAVGDADIVVTSGGISQGAYEVVREVLEPLGGWVGSIRMQPGGPQALAVLEGVPVLSFPGNPVSTQVSFTVLLRPLLDEWSGRAGGPQRAVVAAPIASVPGRRQFLRGVVDAAGTAATVSGPGSHLVAAMASATHLLDLPEDVERLEAGATVRVWAL